MKNLKEANTLNNNVWICLTSNISVYTQPYLHQSHHDFNDLIILKLVSTNTPKK